MASGPATLQHPSPAEHLSPAAATPAVRVAKLVKEFRQPGGAAIRAVDEVSFSVRSGEIFGFLGPNGAGKTTTLEMIEGLQRPTAGTIEVLGWDPHRNRDHVQRAIGVQLQSSSYFKQLTLTEILNLFGSFYPRKLPPEVLLERVGLAEKRGARLAELSGGQAQSFCVAAAMVSDPQVLFLDEPTTGLDPQARRNLWEVIASIRDDASKTVILTTHYMEEAELLCDRVAIMDRGKIKARGTPRELVSGLPFPYRVELETSSAVPVQDLPLSLSASGGVPSSADTYRYTFNLTSISRSIKELLDVLAARHIPVTDLKVKAATLEDVFLSLTGHALR